MDKIKVLLFAANPRGTAPLDLSREFREIDEEVQRGAFRQAVELILVPGTRPVDLLRKLNENQPQVVHFSSHGSPDEIMLEAGDEDTEASGPYSPSKRSADERDMKKVRPDELESEVSGQGQHQGVSGSALVNVLRSCNEGNLRLVVVNACNTRPQAEALTEVVHCVVSMNRTITDRAAIKFAASFYGALAFGRSVQRAFDQGVARLSAEGISESDTPALLVRAGVDASQVTLVGQARSAAAAAAAEAPFIVPFPRNGEFVGRDDDLKRLHASLSGPGVGPVGIRPAGLTGMGGIGKTQLVVEYVYRHRHDYLDGIFWIDAAGPLVEGFARLATDHRLKWAENSQPRDDQIRAAFKELNGRPTALLVLDNVSDPAAIALHLLPDCVPEDLRCRMLFTTRRHDLGRFTGIEVTVLPEEPALRLLLRHPRRLAALDPAHTDHEHARAIARMLGRLPLALELAGAYLGKYSGDVSLEDYREGLKCDGALATLDADAAELTEADLRRVHDPAVAATISEQWQTLQDESARLLLRAASLFPESAALPMVRLGLLAGLGNEARPGRPSPLRRTVRRLDDACLVERLGGDQVRLHPLIREFAARQTLAELTEDLRDQCIARAAESLEDFAIFETLEVRRGVDGLQEDLIAILELCPPSTSDTCARLQALLRLLQREAHNLRVEERRSLPTLVAQQIRNRAFLLGIDRLKTTAEYKLRSLEGPHFRLIWTATRESPSLVRTLTGHQHWVGAVSITPDGRHAVSGSDDSTLKLWDLATGQPRLTLNGHAGPIYAVAVLRDGQRALSGSSDGTVMLWEIMTGQIRRVLARHEGPVFALAITPDERHVLSASIDDVLRLWDLGTGELRGSFACPEGPVYALVITPDGYHALSGGANGNISIWDLRIGQLRQTIVGHEGPVYALAITPDSRQFLSAAMDGIIKLWDVQSGQLVTILSGHNAPVYALAVTRDGQYALSGSGDSTLRLWDLVNATQCGSFVGHDRGVTTLALSPDGRYALSGSTDETLKLWDLYSRQTSLAFTGHERGVAAVAVAPNGRMAVSGSRDCTMRIWNLETPQRNPMSTWQKDWVTALAVTPDGLQVISGCEDSILRLWDLGTGQIQGSLTGHQGGVTAVAVTPDGRHALSGSRDGSLKLWDLQTNRLVHAFAASDSSVSSVAITPDGRHAISGYFDGSIKLWDLLTGELVRMIAAHKSRVSSVAIAPAGKKAVSGSHDSTLKLWDLLTGRLCFTFTGHDDRVTAAVVTTDGRYALSGSEDRTLQLWEIEQCICQAMIPLGSAPMAIALTSDGQTAVIGDRAGNVHNYNIHLR